MKQDSTVELWFALYMVAFMVIALVCSWGILIWSVIPK